MNRSTKINTVMHKLLIERKIDGFSVLELRDAFLSGSDTDVEPGEARRMIYRQILRFTNKKWLYVEVRGNKKKYFQSELFKSLHVVPKKQNCGSNNPNYSVLQLEHTKFKTELKITLTEIEEYQSLMVRFPELESRLIALHEAAKERSVQLLGKVNVLNNTLSTLSDGGSLC